MKIVDETISVEEIKHIFNKIDNNKDDLLNFEEFNHFIES
jgi:Ca2+-binding EF-hand superfamily protein